jgi:hypothetical protein
VYDRDRDGDEGSTRDVVLLLIAVAVSFATLATLFALAE